MTTPNQLIPAQADSAVLDILKKIHDALIEPPRRSDAEGLDRWIVRRVRVVTAGQAVRGPDISVPKGYALVVRQRNHAASNPVGYVGPSEAAVLSTANRVELADGQALTLKVGNMEDVWLSADTADTDFELIVEL